MSRVRHWACLALALTAVGASAALDPGLKPGDFASPFDVYDVTGPNKGTTLCYR